MAKQARTARWVALTRGPNYAHPLLRHDIIRATYELINFSEEESRQNRRPLKLQAKGGEGRHLTPTDLLEKDLLMPNVDGTKKGASCEKVKLIVSYWSRICICTPVPGRALIITM